MKETSSYWVLAVFLILLVSYVISVVVYQMRNNVAHRIFINGRQENRSFKYRALVYGKKTVWYLYSRLNDKYIEVRPLDDKRLTDMLSCADTMKRGGVKDLKVLNKELSTKYPGVVITGTNILHM